MSPLSSSLDRRRFRNRFLIAALAVLSTLCFASSSIAEPGPGTDAAPRITADTPGQRASVIEEHYSIYTDILDPDGGVLSIVMGGFQELTREELYLLPNPEELTAIDPGGYLEPHYQAEAGLGLIVTPQLKEYSEKSLELRRAPNHAEVDSGLIQPLARLMKKRGHTDPELLAVTTFRVDVHYLEEHLSYPALAAWFVDRHGTLDYALVDLTLRDLEQVPHLISYVGGLRAENDLPPRQALSPPPGALQPTKSSDATCRVWQKEYRYPDHPTGRQWTVSSGSKARSGGRLSLGGSFAHNEWTPAPEHLVWWRPTVTCTCNDGCLNVAALDFNDRGIEDVGAEYEWVLIDSSGVVPVITDRVPCHKGPAIPPILKTTEQVSLTDGTGPFIQGAVGWGVMECEFSELANSCNCNPISYEFGAQIQGEIPATPLDGTLNAGAKFTLGPEEKEAWSIQASIQCPDCIREYPVKLIVTGVERNENVDAFISYRIIEDYPLGPYDWLQEISAQQDSSQDFERFFDEPVADGTLVKLEIYATDTSGKVRICEGITRTVDGEILELNADCSCSHGGSLTGSPSGAPTKNDFSCREVYSISGTLELDTSKQGDDGTELGIDGVQVQLTGTPSSGSSDPEITETMGPFSAGANAPVTIQLEFRSKLPSDYSWQVRAIPPGGPNVACQHGSAGNMSNGDVSHANAKCETVPPISAQQNDPILTDPAICTHVPLTCQKVHPENLTWYELLNRTNTCEWWETTVYHTPQPGEPDCQEKETDSSDPDPQHECQQIVTVYNTLKCYEHGLPIPTASPLWSGPIVSVTDSHAHLLVDGIRQVRKGEVLEIDGTSADPEGVLPIVALLDGNPVESISGSTTISGGIDTSSLSLGRHELVLISADTYIDEPLPSVVRIPFDVVEGSGPEVSFTPADGSMVSTTGSVSVDATVTDSAGIERVRLFVDGNLYGQELTAPPWHWDWTPTTGERLLLVRAWDLLGNVTDVRHRVTACEGPEAPSISISSPAAGLSVVEGENLTLSAAVSDDAGVDEVIFLDQAGTELGRSASPFSISWTAVLSTTRIEARVTDACGNTASDQVGISVTPGEVPVLAVSLSGSPLQHGDTLDWGSLAYGSENNQWGGWRLIPKVSNLASVAPLTASIQFQMTQGEGLSLGANVLDAEIAAGGYDSFVLRLDTTDPGTHIGRYLIFHDDPEQPNPFVLNLRGTVLPPGEIQVLRAASPIAHDATHDFGTYIEGSGVKNRAITVQNAAPANGGDLAWDDVVVTNLEGHAFTWTGTLVSPLAPGASDNFAINFNTAAVGSFRARVEIFHSDPVAANPFRFFVETTVDPAPPVLEVKRDGVVLSSGATLDWGTLEYGAQNTSFAGWRFYPVVYNRGPSAALQTSWQLVHTQGSGFAMGGNDLQPSIAAGANDNFVLRLETTTPGRHSAQLAISHNDPDQPNPFILNLTGEVKPPERLQVWRASTPLPHGITHDFGTYTAGSGTKNRAITVQNVATAGASNLEWNNVVVTNLDGAAFSWSGQVVSPLAPGASDNFAINFATAAAGSYRAQVEIWHSDPQATNPHRFYVTMTVTPPPPVVAEFPAIEDTFVSQSTPTKNWGTYSQLSVRSTQSGQGMSTYLKFSVSGLEGAVQSAKLRIYSASNIPSARLYWMQSTSWSETRLTWLNAPLDYHLQREIGGMSAHQWREIDVTDIVTGNGLYTLGLTAADFPSQYFYSRETNRPPALVVTSQP